ncbi:unnamed protein product, partial [Didymodactylos carnosus]
TTNVLPGGNNELVIIQDGNSNQAELINQLQNHITENQQILIITDDSGQDQYVIIDKDQDITALLQDGSLFPQFNEHNLARSNGLEQILQIAPVPIATAPISQPVHIAPKPTTQKPIAPSTVNPSMVSHKSSFQSKINSSAFHVQNVEESVQRVNAPPPKRKPIEIRYDPKENSFQNAFLKFLAGEKVPSLEMLANEPVLRKPKENLYIGNGANMIGTNIGSTCGYQTYILNDESRTEEIMVIGRPIYDDTKGVKINPLLKNLPVANSSNTTTAFLPQTITLTPRQQPIVTFSNQNNNRDPLRDVNNQQQQYINNLTGLFRNAVNNTSNDTTIPTAVLQTVPSLMDGTTTITLPQHLLNQLGRTTMTVIQPSELEQSQTITSIGDNRIEPATASAAAILSQLTEMVSPSFDHHNQQQAPSSQSTIGFLSEDILDQRLSHVNNRSQHEKAADALLVDSSAPSTSSAVAEDIFIDSGNINPQTTILNPSYMEIDKQNSETYGIKNEQMHSEVDLRNKNESQTTVLPHQMELNEQQQQSIISDSRQQTDGYNQVTAAVETDTTYVTEMGPEIPFEIGQFLLYKGYFLNLLHFPIWKVHTKTLLLKYDTVLADGEIAWEATDEGMFYTNVFDDYVPLKCELKGLHNNQEVVRIANEAHPIKLKIHGHMSAVRIQHDVYAQVLVNHVYDADVLPRIKANNDEYATYIRLIDEILEQRYNYVIQSRKTIETFPCYVAKYSLLDVIEQQRPQLHCQVTEDKTQPVSHTLRFHGCQYDSENLKENEQPLQPLEVYVCEDIAAMASTAHALKHHIFHLFYNAQTKVSQLQELNPNADAADLISAICGDSAWLQELFDRFDSIMQQADNYIFSYVEITW